MRCALILLMAAGLWGQAAPYDVIISGARVVDGSGSPWFFADIGIRGDTIAAVGALGNAPSGVRIDAKGLVVAPGFIDIHSHGRRGIAAVPTAENYLREGVTTIVEGPDGSSPVPIAPFLDGIRKMAVSVNFATFVGQGSIRQAVIGLANRPATGAELDKMKEIAAQAMRDGAFGLSTGLFYVPGNFTPTEEVIELAQAWWERWAASTFRTCATKLRTCWIACARPSASAKRADCRRRSRTTRSSASPTGARAWRR